MIDYTLNLNPGDKVAILYSPHIHKVIRVDGSNLRTLDLATNKYANRTLADVLNIVERTKRVDRTKR